jgi:hypothetical protein
MSHPPRPPRPTPAARAPSPKPFCTRHSAFPPSIPPSLHPSSRSPLSPQSSALSTIPTLHLMHGRPSNPFVIPCRPTSCNFLPPAGPCNMPSDVASDVAPPRPPPARVHPPASQSLANQMHAFCHPAFRLEAPRNVALMLMHVSASTRTPGSQSRPRRASWPVRIPRPEPPTPPPCSTYSPSSHLRRMLGCCSSNCKKKIAAF